MVKQLRKACPNFHVKSDQDRSTMIIGLEDICLISRGQCEAKQAYEGQQVQQNAQTRQTAHCRLGSVEKTHFVGY